MVTDTGKVLYTTTADHNDRVLLKVVTNTRDIGDNLIAVCQANTGDLTQSGVRLLGGSCTNSSADAALLRRAKVGFLVLDGVQTMLHGGRGGLIGGYSSSLSYELVKRRHSFPPFFSYKIIYFSGQPAADR